MALVSIKQILFPQDRNADYHRVQQAERGGNNMTGTAFEEKPFHLLETEQQQQQSRARINPRIISDAIIGLSDGLTVPFALTAGLSALGESHVVVYGGLAELIAGGISMGLGGYLGARSEYEAYNAALSETKQLVASGDQQQISSMIHATFADYQFQPATLDAMTANLLEQPGQLVDFLMRFHHRLAEDDYGASRAYASGVTISSGYFFGGLIPLMPYLFFAHVHQAFVASVLVMAMALFAFGWVKTSLVGESDRWVCLKNAVQMLVLGGVAAGAAMGCVKAIGG